MLHLYCLRGITPECVIIYGLILVQHLLELSHFFGRFVFLPSVKPTKKIYSGRRFSSGSIVLRKRRRRKKKTSTKSIATCVPFGADTFPVATLGHTGKPKKL